MSKKHRHKKKRFQNTFKSTENPETAPIHTTAPVEKELATSIKSPQSHASLQELRTIGLIVTFLLVLVVIIVTTSSRSDYLTSLSNHLAHLVNIE